MATSQMSGVLDHLRRTVLLRDGAGLTDGQLLEDYLGRRDEAALAALVRRHGPMVWGVCRRVLRSHHDAEDAFQATFLVLVRKAASIMPREMVANWLYGVAHHTALKARATTAKRKGRERQVTKMPEPAAAEQASWHDLQPMLDEELSRLPDKYRSVIILCDLEGRTRKEAARQLGVPEGTVGGWLARARTALAKRLAERRVLLSGGALAVVPSQNVASAGVPTSVVSSTIKAASLVGAGHAAAPGVISAKVAALAEGVMKTMLLTKIKTMTAVLVVMVVAVVGALSLGTGPLDPHSHAAEPNKGSKDDPKAPPARQAKTDQQKLAGTWEVQVEETEKAVGVPLGDTFKPCKLTFQDGEVLFANKYGKQLGTFTLNEKTDPKQIHMKFMTGAGIAVVPPHYEEYRGNYLVDGDVLKIRYTTAKAFPPEAQGSLRTAVVFKRQPEGKKGDKIDKP